MEKLLALVLLIGRLTAEAASGTGGTTFGVILIAAAVVVLLLARFVVRWSVRLLKLVAFGALVFGVVLLLASI